MVYQAYCCKDTATGVYHLPFFCRSEAEAYRNIRTYYRIHEDSHEALLLSELYLVGEYDDLEGCWTYGGNGKFQFIEFASKILAMKEGSAVNE